MTGLNLFLELGAQLAALLARNVTFAVGFASKPVACHAAVLQVAECNQVLAVKSLLYLQCQGHCLMRLLMRYTH